MPLANKINSTPIYNIDRLPATHFDSEAVFITTVDQMLDVSNINKELLVWYKLDTGSGITAINSAYNSGYNGAIYGASWSSSPKIGSYCIDFDATNERITIPAMNLNSNTVTIACWVNGIANDWYTGVIFTRAGSSCAGLNVHKTERKLGYHWNGSNYESSLLVPDNTWCHIAMVVTPSGITLYLDGASVTNSFSVSAEEFDGTTDIGQDPLGSPSSTRRWIGRVDDVRIYPRSLSASEIAVLAAMPQW